MQLRAQKIRILFTALFLYTVATTIGQELPNFQNVIVLLADDHALKVTGAYGNDLIRTPSIDRLADQGVTFNRAYCNAPICSASRQSLLTGKYPHATGVNLLFTPFPDEGNITIAEHLREQNYETALIGKTHFNNWVWSSLYQDGLPDHGFDLLVEGGDYRQHLKDHPPRKIPDDLDYYTRDVGRENTAEWMNYRALPHPVYDEDSEATFFANRAVDFIRQNREKPFFLWLAFRQPHHPYYFPIEYAGKYDPADMPLPEGSPEDDRWMPEKFRDLSDAEKRGIIAAYYSSTEYMDKNIGRVLDALDEMDIADNTIVIYISDNGYLLHEHKRFEKHTMWEEAVRQPMVIRAGKGYRGGQRENALVEYIDIVPTLLEMIQAEPLEEAQGRSFLPVLTNQSKEHREFTFAEYLEDNLAMVCTEEWKYMFTTGRRDLGIGYRTGYGPSGIVHRLYNLQADPTESHNLADDPKYADILLEMQQKMLQRFQATHPEADRCPQGLSLEGKLVWFCEPRDVGTDQANEDAPYRVFKK